MPLFGGGSHLGIPPQKFPDGRSVSGLLAGQICGIAEIGCVNKIFVVMFGTALSSTRGLGHPTHSSLVAKAWTI